MSQHLTGSMSQTQNFNYGEFITSGNLRLRKDLIFAYMKQFDPEKGECVGVKFLISGGWLVADFDDAGAEREIQRLDWFFKKEYGHYD